jgi:glucan 1,3-beta-glucosidase
MSGKNKNAMRFHLANKALHDDFLQGLSESEIRDRFASIVASGVHGFCYSAYEEGQKPGDILSEAQIQKRLSILKNHCSWIRTFSCTDGNENIAAQAKQMGLKTLVGAWLGPDEEKNEIEINNLITLAQQGFVDIAAVGNEVLYREELNEDRLIAYIQHVKQRIPGIPVGYVDAYYEFVEKPAVTSVCDIILCNCYPYWEGTSIQGAFQHMQIMYNLAQRVAGGKRVIITETGWPSRGMGLDNALPSPINAMKYFLNTQLWAQKEDIELFYFASFDEPWKISGEGDVGAYWGVWDKHEKLKYV